MDLRPKGKEGERGMHACAWVEMADTYPETYFHALFCFSKVSCAKE